MAAKKLFIQIFIYFSKPLRLLYFTQIFIYFSKPLRLLYSLIIGRAGASPPSRTAAIIFLYIYIFIYLFIYLYIYIYPYVRRALNLLRASFSPIFQYFSAVNVTRARVSFSPIFKYFLTCMRHAPWIRQPWKVPSTLIVTFESEEVLFIEL